jgi:hypothetical protein
MAFEWRPYGALTAVFYGLLRKYAPQKPCSALYGALVAAMIGGRWSLARPGPFAWAFT